MKFQKGQSGNPAGRPRGIKDRRIAIGEKYRNMVWKKIIELAMQGDVRALQMAADRCLPKLKSEFEKVTLPKFKNAKGYADEIVRQVAAGNIAPNVGRDLLELATQQVSLTDLEELQRRIQEIENETFVAPPPEVPKEAAGAPRRRRKRVRVRMPR